MRHHQLLTGGNAAPNVQVIGFSEICLADVQLFRDQRQRVAAFDRVELQRRQIRRVSPIEPLEHDVRSACRHLQFVPRVFDRRCPAP